MDQIWSHKSIGMSGMTSHYFVKWRSIVDDSCGASTLGNSPLSDAGSAQSTSCN